MASPKDGYKFFFMYRKGLIVFCGIILLMFPFEVYRGITKIKSGETWSGIGALIDGCIVFLVLPVYMLVNVRRAIKLSQADEVDNQPL